MTTRRLALALAVTSALIDTPRRGLIATGSDWTQWGGPTRNFMSDTTGLASAS